MYHGHWKALETLEGIDDICLAFDSEISESYGNHVHEIRVSDDAVIADESDFLAALEADSFETTPGVWFFEIADSRKARDIVAAAGFHGVRYDDATEDNAQEHETIRIWDTSCLELIK